MKKTYIIAEAGVNHNGSIEIAYELVNKAVEAGADAVKFQTFTATNLVSIGASKAEYQKKDGDDESQLEMLSRLELSKTDHLELSRYCLKKGIEFLSTPFDLVAIDLLSGDLRIQRLKISSADITNAPLLLAASKTGMPIILSTGMCTLGEIECALGVLAFGYSGLSGRPSIKYFEESYCDALTSGILSDKVSLMHCTTNYPANPEEVNLLAMDTLRKSFSLPVGYSDHTSGISVPIAAVALGAEMIEKHFTLNKEDSGPDHKASLEPLELKSMVDAIREVEKALGKSFKGPSKSEIENREIARRSIFAAQDIKCGDVFTDKNLGIKRPGNGVNPMRYWEYLDEISIDNYALDEKIKE